MKSMRLSWCCLPSQGWLEENMGLPGWIPLRDKFYQFFQLAFDQGVWDCRSPRLRLTPRRRHRVGIVVM